MTHTKMLFKRFVKKAGLAILFIGFYVKELIRSNLRIAREVMTPWPRRRTGIIGVPLDAKTDFEIMLLANLITLTPGSMSVDISEDRSTLYIHAMFIHDAEAFRRSIKQQFEKRVLELLR